MKPCARFREDLALLAAGALEDAPRALVLAHVQECPACRRSLAGLSDICRDHSGAVEPWSALEPSDGFHGRLAERVRAAAPGAGQGFMAEWAARLAALRWRLAFPAAAALALIALASWHFAGPRPSAPAGPSMKASAPRVTKPAGEWLAYRLAANQSFDTLDALLARHAAVPAPSAAQVTAGMREMSGLTE